MNDPRLQSSGHVWEYFTNYVWAQNAGGPASFYWPFFVLWLRLSFILSDTYSWGWHLLSVAKHDEAVPIFQQAIQQYSQDWFAWAGLRKCYFKLNDPAKAEQAMHRAADLSGEPRVKEEWQEMREKMDLSPAP